MARLDDATEDYLDALAGAAAMVLGDNLLGAYLHGSAVLGGYDVRRSDVDVLVVSRSALTRADQDVFADAVSQERLPCPAKGLELSVVTAASAATPRARPPYELHVTTAPEDRKVVDGHLREGDPDLVLHYAVCRAAGRPLGDAPPAEQVFEPMPDSLVLAQLRAELEWALESAPGQYAVLNACRAWRWADDGRLVSKIDGGAWAVERLEPPERIWVERALARQRGDEAVQLDAGEVQRFVREVGSRLG